jgi:hypothetical protein
MTRSRQNTYDARAWPMLARRTVLGRSALLATLLALGAAGSGRAGDPRDEARAHYARGLELAGQNGYEGALREFTQAYEVSPQFAVLFNIGQAQIALGHTVEAIEALTRYLRDGGDRIAPPRRAQVERQITGLRATLPNPEVASEAEAARLAAVAAGNAAGAAIEAASEGSRASTTRPGTLTVHCPEPGLKLMLDGKRIDQAASTRGIALPGGVHHLVMSAPGRRAADERLEIDDGGAALVVCETLLLATAPPTTSPREALLSAPVFAPVSVDSTSPTIHAKTVAYLLGGLGVALGGTAIGVYLSSRSLNNTAESERSRLASDPYNYPVEVKYNADVDSLRSKSILTVGLAVTSVGLLAGGAYLYLYERKRDAKTGEVDSARSWASVTPGGLFWNGIW